MMSEGKRDSPIEDDIEYYFGFNLKILSLIGFKYNVNKKARNAKFVEKLPTFMTNILGIFVLVLGINLVLNVYSSDVALVIQIVTQLISNVICISKGFLVANSISHIQNAFERIKVIWDKYHQSNDQRVKILSIADRTLLFCKFYFVITMSGIVVYGMPPLVNFLKQYRYRNTLNHTYDFSQRILLVTYPFQINTVPIFLLVLFQETYFLAMSAVFWVSSDTLFAQLITHICLQIKVLKYDVEAAFNNETFDYLKLTNFVRRHRELLRICKLLEDIFSPIIFITMLLSSVNVCVNLIEAKEMISSGYYQESVKYLTTLVHTFFQILFYCIFAEILTEETGSFADSVYNCKWTSQNYKFKLYIHLTIVRAQKPFYCTAYGFFPIGHKQLTTIINTSFSYYMMIQTMS